MCDMVDVVVAKLRETPKWQYIPDGAADPIIAELKSLYTGSSAVTFSPSQAISLMELTGRKLGEAIEVQAQPFS